MRLPGAIVNRSKELLSLFIGILLGIGGTITYNSVDIDFSSESCLCDKKPTRFYVEFYGGIHVNVTVWWDYEQIIKISSSDDEYPVPGRNLTYQDFDVVSGRHELFVYSPTFNVSGHFNIEMCDDLYLLISIWHDSVTLWERHSPFYYL